MGIYTRHMPDDGDWELVKLTPKEAARAAILKGLHDMDGDSCFQQCLYLGDGSGGAAHGKAPTEREQEECLRQYSLFWNRLYDLLTKGASLPYDDVRNICNPTAGDF